MPLGGVGALALDGPFHDRLDLPRADRLVHRAIMVAAKTRTHAPAATPITTRRLNWATRRGRARRARLSDSIFCGPPGGRVSWSRSLMAQLHRPMPIWMADRCG